MATPLNYSCDQQEHANAGENAAFPRGQSFTTIVHYKRHDLPNSNCSSSSTSGSSPSSVTTCEHCVPTFDSQCSCRSDSAYGEGESIRQPNTSPTEYAELVAPFTPRQNTFQQYKPLIMQPDSKPSDTPSPILLTQHDSEKSTPTKIANDTSACAEGESEISKAAANDDACESEVADDGMESEEESEDEGYDWSGQNDDLEATVLNCLTDDLPLAAHLIPILHKALYTQFQTNIKGKVGPWRNGVKCAAGEVEGENGRSSSSHESSGSPTDHRKRPRLPDRGGSRKSGGREDDNDEEDENDDGRNGRTLDDTSSNNRRQQLPRFACPFYKWDPAKYCVQYGASDNPDPLRYRTCAGPGFGNIQRLKEHLKRKHYPVQCERCFEIFTNADRPSALNDLRMHGRSSIQCEVKSTSLKEGISDSQCAQMDKKKNNKKDQETSAVEKWYEIWVILFPEKPKPLTPWYENIPTEPARRLSQEENRKFDALFQLMLRKKVDEGDIQFAPGMTEDMICRVEILAHQAYEVNAGLWELSSATTSSSARSRALTELLGGSYVNLSESLLSGVDSPQSVSHTRAVPSQTVPMNVPNSPTAASLITNPGNEHSIHPPAGMYSTRMAQSSMAHQGSRSNTATSGMSNNHYIHDNYPVRIANPTVGFGNQGLSGGGIPSYNYGYGAPSNINLEHTFINQSSPESHLDCLPDWDPIFPRGGYNGA